VVATTAVLVALGAGMLADGQAARRGLPLQTVARVPLPGAAVRFD
jgi:hypothetical protein